MAVINKGSKRSISKVVSAPVKKVKNNKAKAVPVEEPSSEEESEDEMDVESEQSEEDELDVSDESEDDLDDLDEKKVEKSEKVEQNDDEDDEEEVEDDDSNEDGEKPVDPNKKSSKEQHAEQRKLLADRKLQRKSGSEVQRIKALWERLRVSKPAPPKEVRDKLGDEIWDLAKDVIKDLVMKHDASRVVQTLIKYTSKERREVIVQSLKGNFYELATSSYGKYLLIKLLHYGSKESKELILNELHGKLRKLMRHREGAYVVEDLFTLYSTAKQKQQMIREFWGSEYAVFRDSGEGKTIVEICNESTEKKSIISKNLIGTITASVEKGSTGFQILHAAMKEYIQIFEGTAVREFIELLAEQFAELVHTPEGCEVACTLIAKANAKERKVIVRSLKQHAGELIKNEHGNLVLITLFMTVDDTVLVGKTFSTEYAADVAELIKQKFSRRPFLYLLSGLNPSYFSPGVRKELEKYEEMSKETSKKPQEQRRVENLKAFLPLLYDGISENIYDVLADNMGAQFVSELVLNTCIEDEDISAKRTDLINKIVEAFKGDVLEEFHIINKPFSARLLRPLVQGGVWNFKEKKLEKVDIPEVGASFALKLLEQIEEEDRLVSWIQTPGSMVIVSIYESLLENDKKKHKELTKTLKKHKADIKDAAEDNNKGAQLLLKLESN